MSEIRTPYDKRDHWMQEIHRQYGQKCHLQDIDSLNDMWIEHSSGQLAALAEFKNDYEIIEPYKYQAMTILADNSKIPFYIVVGYRQYPAYYIIPMNEYAKQIPWCHQSRFFSEYDYVKFLHYIRKMKVDPKVLEGKNRKIPDDIKMPNFK